MLMACDHHVVSRSVPHFLFYASYLRLVPLCALASENIMDTVWEHSLASVSNRLDMIVFYHSSIFDFSERVRQQSGLGGEENFVWTKNFQDIRLALIERIVQGRHVLEVNTGCDHKCGGRTSRCGCSRRGSHANNSAQEPIRSLLI